MRTPIPAIAGRECKGLLVSPMGYWVLLCFTVFFWYLYHGAVERLRQMPRMSPYELTPLAAFFDPGTVAAALLMMVPAITMKLFPEEKSQGTYEFLLTCPVREWHIVAGKFLGAWLYYSILWLLSLFPLFLISRLGPVDWGQVAAVYLWFFVCGWGLIALGLLVSTFFVSQLACFATTFIILLPFTGYVFGNAEGRLYLSSHLITACRGTVDFSCHFFSASIAAVALFTAGKIIEVRRYFSRPAGAPSIRTGIVLASGTAISLVIACAWGLHFKSFLVLALLAAASVRLALISDKKSRLCQEHPVVAANAAVSAVSLAVIALAANYLLYPLRLRLDISASRAFTLDCRAVSTIRSELARGELIEVTAMFALSDRPGHEHLERDNERYYILQEALRKLAESFGDNLSYRFVSASTPEATELQNRCGVGYRDILFQYRGRGHIVSDSELFAKDLDPADVPRLLVLWRKIYEAGGIIEPPPDPKDENILEKLRQKANPEMLAIYPAPGMEETLITAVYRVVRGSRNRVYFAQGAGEKWVAGTVANEYRTAYRLATTLRRYNFEVLTLRLDSAGSIPEDCDALVILGTDEISPYRRESLKLLDDYLKNRKGRLILLSEKPDQGIASLLRAYGVETDSAIAAWYDLSGDTPQKKTMLDIPLDSTEEPLREILNGMYGEGIPVIHIHRAGIVHAMSRPGVWVRPIWRLENPRIFAEGEGQTASGEPRPVSVGVIAREDSGEGWKLAVIGNADFTGDSPSAYYQYIFGDPTTRPQILLGCNRLVLPALLKYMIKPSPKVAVTVAPPIRFRLGPISDLALRVYFWCNLLLSLVVAAIGVWRWRRDEFLEP